MAGPKKAKKNVFNCDLQRELTMCNAFTLEPIVAFPMAAFKKVQVSYIENDLGRKKKWGKWH